MRKEGGKRSTIFHSYKSKYLDKFLPVTHHGIGGSFISVSTTLLLNTPTAIIVYVSENVSLFVNIVLN